MPMKGKYTINFFLYQGAVALRCRVVVKVSLLEVLTSLKGYTLFITSSAKTLLGVFACSRTGSAAVAFFAPISTTTSSPR